MRAVKKIADLQVGNRSDLEASIPAAIANGGGTIEIELRIPKATSLKALGQSSDQRVSQAEDPFTSLVRAPNEH
jgi:hypothetical protein